MPQSPDARCMASPHPLPASLGGVFSVGAALRDGVSRGRLRAGDLVTPFWGVRALADVTPELGFAEGRMLSEDERTALSRILLYAPRMSERAFLSHGTAALAWGAQLPSWLVTVVHVSVLRPHRAPRGAGVSGHQLAPEGVVVQEHGGLRMTSPATTWAQLAALLSMRDLVAVGDAFVNIPRDPFGHRRGPETALTTKDALAAAASSVRRAGAPKARRALELVRIGASSRPETHLRLAILDAGLPEPELDVDVFDDSGRKLGHSEIVYPRHRVAVEYEGLHHLKSARQWNRDIAKYEAYAAAGWAIVRITAEHLYTHPQQAPARVRGALLRAGWHPGVE